ncbi:MAG: hypothetical protein WAO24_02250 [Peptococcia bacterium]
MKNTTLTLSSDGVKIQGSYYTVSNGFTSKQDGSISIPYKDLLSVDYVKRRSKRIMYIVLLLGSLLILVLSGVRTNIGRTIESLDFKSLQSTYITAQKINDAVQNSNSSDFYKTLKVIVTGIIILTAIVCVFCIIYLFSRRKFIEITSMRGTYRVAVQGGDMELPHVVSQLQARISQR